MIDVNVEVARADDLDPVRASLVRPATVLIRHRLARLHDPLPGNAQAAAAARRLQDGGVAAYVVAVVAPIRGEPDDLVRASTTQGAVGFWLEHAAWRGSPTTPSAALDALLAAVARTGLPVLVPLRAWGDATAIGRATAAFGMPVVLVGAHYDHIVDDLAAAQRYPHLVLETSALAHYGAVSRAVAAIGAERLLFGSGRPDRASEAPRGAVLAAPIRDEDKTAILGGTAARLFGIPLPAIDLVADPAPGDLVDVHTHLGGGPWDVTPPTDAELLPDLARHGTRVAVASSILGITGDAPAGNEATVEACATTEGLLGYLVANPNDPDGTRADLRRWADRPGIVGVKIHCQWSGCETASQAVADVVAAAAPILDIVKIHVDGPGWETSLAALADRHRAVRFIVAHAGPGAPAVAAAEVARDRDNVFLELASSFAAAPVVRAVVETAGPDRLLFGSDAPLLDPAFALGTYREAGIAADRIEDVFAGNARRLFGLRAAA